MTQVMDAPANLPARQQNGNGAIQKLNMRAPVGNTMTLKRLLETSTQQIADVLPKHMTPDRIMRVALVAVNKTPKLLECTMESVLQSIIQAASLGLDPGGALGSAYLVPYGTTCQLIPGYRGLIDLARRSGEIQSISAEVVYKHDKFTYRKGTDPVLLHEPNIHDEQRDEDIMGAYMVAHLKDGGKHVEFMNRQQIEKIRKGSRSGNSGPWRDHFSEMCRKTVVRRGSKYLPISSEKFAQALEIENDDHDAAAMSVSIAQGRSRTDALLAKVTSRPVSEGQTLEPTPEAMAAAAEGMDDGAHVVEGTVEPDVSGADTEPPAPDLSSYEAWYEAMEGVYAGNSNFSTVMAGLALNTSVKKPGAKGQADRDRAYRAALAGKVAPDGKILD